VERATLILGDGRRLHLFATAVLRMGRSSEADMPLICVFPGNHKATTLANRTISRKHLEFYREGPRVLFVDGWRETAAPSTHGISVDGMRVNYGELQAGRNSIVSIGSGARAPHIPHWQLHFIPQAAGQGMAGLFFRRLDVVQDDMLWLWGPINLQSLGLSGSELWIDSLAAASSSPRARAAHPYPPKARSSPACA
jgi:hypothetical protein